MLDASRDRQSFLGTDLQHLLNQPLIGVAGLSGGGSHIVQQLAHIGFQRFAVFDPKHIEDKHLHRLVGGTLADVHAATPKVEIARRVIQEISPRADVHGHVCRWQERPEALRRCDVVLGCVDTFIERQELEICSRRFLFPYIDMGMEVFPQAPRPPRMCGQVVLSMPGFPCMFCLGLLNDETLAREAQAYGAAGGRPQVVWANGVLASTAVGILIDLLTDWSGSLRGPVHLEYDGNRHHVYDDRRLAHRRPGTCPHYSLADVASPRFRRL